MVVIYKIESPSNKVYIGQSINFKVRRNKYKNMRCEMQPKLYNSFIKYGFKSHVFSIIHELPVDVSQIVINNYERLYMELFNNCGYELLNVREGGSNGKLNESTKAKIGDAHRGKIMSEEAKTKIGNASRGNKNMLGYKHTEETKKKISEAGKMLSQEMRQKLSNLNTGRKHTDEAKAKMSLAMRGNTNGRRRLDNKAK